MKEKSFGEQGRERTEFLPPQLVFLESLKASEVQVTPVWAEAEQTKVLSSWEGSHGDPKSTWLLCANPEVPGTAAGGI